MLFFIVLLFFGSFGVSDSLRVKDNIRIPLTSVKNNCMGLLNKTHQFGCQSNRDGNSGVVAIIRTTEDIQKHLEILPWGLSQLIALVNVKNLDGKLLSELRDNDNVVGVLLYRNQTERFDGFSEDGYCPNKENSFYPPSNQCTWNQKGALSVDGFFFAQYNKPVFMVTNQTEISLLMDACYRSFNKPSSDENSYRCVARMKAFMLAAGDGLLCRERQKHGSLTNQGQVLCDELFDGNVISLLPALDANQQKADILTLATRMDSFSLFSGSKGGDISSLVSVIAELAVAKSVGHHRVEFEQKARETQRQLMFAYFNVESFGYIGSSRYVYDMQHPPSELKYKPERSARHIQLSDLNTFVELQQLSANHSTFYLHGDAQVAKEFEPAMRDLQKSAESGANKAGAQVRRLYTQPNARLPPASYQSFLKAKHLPGFVIAPFADQYETRTLNSFFDTQLSELKSEQSKEQILRDVQAAGNIALRIALDFIGNNDKDFVEKFEFDREFASQLVDCFIFDPTWNCTFFAELLKNQSMRIVPHNTYIEYHGQSSIRKLVNAIMIHSLGNIDAASNIKHESECISKNKNQDLYTYFWLFDPQTNQFHCYQTSTYVTTAASPEFDIEDYDPSNYTFKSRWFESRWENTQLEVFLDAGYKFELHALGLALIIIVASSLLFYFLDESFFVNPTDVLPAEV